LAEKSASAKSAMLSKSKRKNFTAVFSF